MTRGQPSRQLALKLEEAAAAYQNAVVIPHCAQCSRPCCHLDPLVLELEWKQVKVLWRIEEPRAVFDAKIASGAGPEEIRAADGLYFVHGKVCPAYDQAQHTCRIYGQRLKPQGCTDFPVYLDWDCLVADLRCEAVNIDELARRVEHAVGPGFKVVRTADKDFPFMVTLSLRRVAGDRKARGGSKGR